MSELATWHAYEIGVRHGTAKATVGRYTEQEFRDALGRAILAEREACAAIADTLFVPVDSHDVGAAIRNRPGG